MYESFLRRTLVRSDQEATRQQAKSEIQYYTVHCSLFTVHLYSSVQDMPSQYFALLNIASAVEECDARKDQ